MPLNHHKLYGCNDKRVDLTLGFCSHIPSHCGGLVYSKAYGSQDFAIKLEFQKNNVSNHDGMKRNGGGRGRGQSVCF